MPATRFVGPLIGVLICYQCQLATDYCDHLQFSGRWSVWTYKKAESCRLANELLYSSSCSATADAFELFDQYAWQGDQSSWMLRTRTRFPRFPSFPYRDPKGMSAGPVHWYSLRRVREDNLVSILAVFYGIRDEKCYRLSVKLSVGSPSVSSRPLLPTRRNLSYVLLSHTKITEPFCPMPPARKGCHSSLCMACAVELRQAEATMSQTSHYECMIPIIPKQAH